MTICMLGAVCRRSVRGPIGLRELQMEFSIKDSIIIEGSWWWTMLPHIRHLEQIPNIRVEDLLECHSSCFFSAGTW